METRYRTSRIVAWLASCLGMTAKKRVPDNLDSGQNIKEDAMEETTKKVLPSFKTRKNYDLTEFQMQKLRAGRCIQFMLDNQWYCLYPPGAKKHRNGALAELKQLKKLPTTRLENIAGRILQVLQARKVV